MSETRDNVVMVHKFKSKAEADAVRERKLQHFLLFSIHRHLQAAD